MTNPKWLSGYDECECCGKEMVGWTLRRMYGIGYTKTSKACEECHEEYFEQVKSQYFVEEYKGNKIYEWDNRYFPYWDATYAYDTIEDCRTRIDNAKVASVDMNSFMFVNSMMK